MGGGEDHGAETNGGGQSCEQAQSGRSRSPPKTVLIGAPQLAGTCIALSLPARLRDTVHSSHQQARTCSCALQQTPEHGNASPGEPTPTRICLQAAFASAVSSHWPASYLDER